MTNRRMVVLVNDGTELEVKSFEVDGNPVKKTNTYIDWLSEIAQSYGLTGAVWINVVENGVIIDKHDIQII